MPQEKKAHFRPSVLGFKTGAGGAQKIKVDLGDIPATDIDGNTPVVLRVYVKPTPRHPGYFSQVGVFTDNAGAPQTGTGKLTDVNKIKFYIPKEKGFHVMILTTVEDGAAHTYRTGIIKVT